MIKGMITSVGQLGPPVGNYQICYQDITILTGEGQTTTGNIGSKKGFAINTPISVEVTQDPQYGTKFKRIDPNYPQTTTSQQAVKTTASNPVSSIVSTNVQIIRQCCIKAAARMLTREGDIVKLVKYTIETAKDFEAYVLGTTPTSPHQPAATDKNEDIPF